MSFLYDSIVQSGNNGSTKNESNLGETLKYGSEPEFESKISHLSNYDIKQYQLEKIVETLSNCEFQPETVKSENSEKKLEIELDEDQQVKVKMGEERFSQAYYLNKWQ